MPAHGARAMANVSAFAQPFTQCTREISEQYHQTPDVEYRPAAALGSRLPSQYGSPHPQRL